MIQIALLKGQDFRSENEIIGALSRAGMFAQILSWNESAKQLSDFQGFIITGDDISQGYPRPGVLAAFSPMMQALFEQSKLGKPILGIGNGAHILVEAGLVPGLERNQLGLALTDNESDFHPAQINIRLSKGYQWNAFTRHLSPQTIFQITSSVNPARFMIPPVLLAEIERNGLDVFQYCNDRGVIASDHSIAAIANKTGNVMAMLPHPEHTKQGEAIFTSMREYIVKRCISPSVTLDYQPRFLPLKKYHASAYTFEYVTSMAEMDPCAITVENVLFENDMPVKIKRAIHWEIQCDSESIFEEVKSTGVLSGDNQKAIIHLEAMKEPQQTVFLVRPKEDILGLQKLETLKNNFGLEGIQKISYSTLWYISASEKHIVDRIIRSTLLFNPYSHDCFYY